jgi:hypothetical protein
MIDWSRVAVYGLLAVVILGVCLYFALTYLISLPSSQPVIYGFNATYLLSTVLSGMLPWFFWTALGFVIASVGVGLYMGSRHMITKEPNVESLVYFFGSAILIDILLWAALGYLIYSVIPTLPGLGTSQQENMLGDFAGTCLLPLFCFVLAGIGAGLYIGSHVDAEK